MTDYFQLLELDRRPWLDLEALKNRFIELSAVVHPDRVHKAVPDERAQAQQRYTTLNAAFQCLRNPKDRLRHLLELERGAKPPEVEQLPGSLMQKGWTIAQLCREADQLRTQKRRAADSPLLELACFEQSQATLDRLRAAQEQLAKDQAPLLTELQTANELWAAAPPMGSAQRMAQLPLERMEQIYRLLSYLQRWDRQLQDRVTELSV
jgi:DnaJ-domain-containing protein 1